MGKQLRDLLEKNNYNKKFESKDGTVIGKDPKRKDIEDAIGGTPTSNVAFELNDKKGNVFAIDYNLEEDNYYYGVKTLVTK